MLRVAAILIASGGVLYAAWFLQWIVPTDLSATSSFISELSATDQPHHWLFRTTDLLAGVSLVLGSVAAMSSTPRSRWMLTGWASLLLFGVSTIADASEDLFFGMAMLSLMVVAWRSGVPVVLRRVAMAVAVAYPTSGASSPIA